MVTAGFIVEGYSEAAFIKDSSFIGFLSSLNVLCRPQLVINAKGKYNLYHPKRDFKQIQPQVESWINVLKDSKAEVIFLLIDFNNSDTCFTQFKSKVFHQPDNIIIIAKQALESWFLADTQALSNYMQKRIEIVQQPESFAVPFEEMKSLCLMHSNKGISDKRTLTINTLKSGFSLGNAASHPNCPSAAYFLNKLQSLNTPSQL